MSTKPLPVKQTILEFKGVCKSFQQGTQTKSALREVSFHVRSGEFVALLGASGSGKSTLLNLAAGLDQPDSGEIRLFGRDLGELKDAARSRLRRQHLGFIFQSFQLLPTLNNLDNILLPARLDRRDEAQAELAAKAWLKRFGLAGREADYPEQLSGGEQQRVAVARALINRPSLILGDEPTGNLHHQASLEIFQLFSQLAKNEGLSLLIASHNLEIKKFARRVVHLQDGKVINPSR